MKRQLCCGINELGRKLFYPFYLVFRRLQRINIIQHPVPQPIQSCIFSLSFELISDISFSFCEKNLHSFCMTLLEVLSSKFSKSLSVFALLLSVITVNYQLICRLSKFWYYLSLLFNKVLAACTSCQHMCLLLVHLFLCSFLSSISTFRFYPNLDFGCKGKSWPLFHLQLKRVEHCLTPVKRLEYLIKNKIKLFKYSTDKSYSTMY